MWWVDEKFRAFSAYHGDLVAIRVLVEVASGISGGMTGKLEVALDPHKPSPLHGNDIKQQPLVCSSVWHACDLALMIQWHMAKR